LSASAESLMMRQEGLMASTAGEPWGDETGIELIVALSVSRPAEPALSLLWGLNPDTAQWLAESQELESLLPYLRFCRRDELRAVEGVPLWLRVFPDLLEAPLKEPQ